MAIKSVFALLLICLLGVVCGKGIKIKTTYEERKSMGQECMYSLVNLFVGDSVGDNSSAPKALSKPSYVCTKPNSTALLFYASSSMTKMEIVLYIAKDSKSYVLSEGPDAEVDFSIGKRNVCFVFGTYHPKNSFKLHLYLNFIGNVQSISDYDIIFLKSIYAEKVISSALMINSYKKPTEELIELAFPGGVTKIGTNQQIALQLVKQNMDKSKFIMGYSTCDVDRTQIEFKLDEMLIAQTDEGELNITFVTMPISAEKASDYGLRFLKHGANHNFPKYLATMDCSGTGFQLKTLIKAENRRMLSDDETYRNILI